MEQLSSCYFCGAALDAQIEPYQVIPPQLEPTRDQQRAVSLCPSCRQKLGHIVETVVAATDVSAAVTTDDVSTPDPAGDLVRNEAATEADSNADGGSTGEPETAATETPADEKRADAGDSRAESDEQQAADDEERGRDAAGTIDRTRSNDARDDGRRQNGSHEQPSATTHGRSDAQPSSDPPSADTGSSNSQSPGQGQSAGGSRSASQSASPDADDDTNREQQSHSADEQAAADDGPSLTALEYNKVMRLLQNREFPVERAEIQAVATNAYEISEQEFDAIIDAAIDRDLIGEENGQLVSGD